MKHARTILMAAAVFSLAAASPMAGGKDDKHNQVPKEAWVQFGDLVTPAPAANTVEAAKTHFLLPDDVTIEKGGTVTFIVNGGGHGIAIHRVSKMTSVRTSRRICARVVSTRPTGPADSWCAMATS